MTTDWHLIGFQTAQSVFVVSCTVVLGYFLNRRSAQRIERLKVDLTGQQVIRNEKKDVYFRVLGILGRMRDAVDEVRLSVDSGSVEPAFRQLGSLRGELHQIAPCAVMMLKDKAASAIEAYRRVAEPALKLNPHCRERWDQEAEAIVGALKVLIAAGQQDLGL